MNLNRLLIFSLILPFLGGFMYFGTGSAVKSAKAAQSVSESAPESTSESIIEAVPVVDVIEETLGDHDGNVVVLELFSSQACVFCPRADRIFADIASQDNVIGLACHVDYFDVRNGSLAQEFCTARQQWYMDHVFNSPLYTPQLVMNGRTDVVGYRLEQVVDQLQKEHRDHVNVPLDVIYEADGTLVVTAPDDASFPADHTVWVMLYDDVHDLVIAQGRNKGQRVRYHRIVSAVKDAGRFEKPMSLDPDVKPGHAGAAVLVQDRVTGHILAAGRISFNR